MSDSSRPDSPTVQAHKRQFVWQILVPFLVAAILLVAAAVLAVTSTSPGTRLLADVSVIWLIAPLLIFAVLLAVLLGFMIYGLAKLIKLTPRVTGQAQYYTALAAAGTHKVADGAVRPVVWIRQVLASLQTFFDKL